MAQIRVTTEYRELPKKKDGWPRQRPVEVTYNVFIDGELEFRTTKPYGLVEGHLLLEGAVKAKVKDLQERYKGFVEANRAIEFFNAQKEALKIDQTIEV